MTRTPHLAAVAACLLALGAGAWLMLRPSTTATRDAELAESPCEAASASEPIRVPRERAVEPDTEPMSPPDPGSEVAPRESTASGHLVVRVSLGRKKEPAAGARVVVSDSAEKVHEAMCDESGVALVAEELPVDYVQVTVSLPGYRSFSDSVQVEASGATTTDVELERATTVVGVVTEDDGRPLPGAEIKVLGDSDGWCCTGPPDPLATATSGADGTFRLDEMPAERTKPVWVSAPRHVTRYVVWTPGVVERFEVRLEPAGTLTGIVRDPEGEPVEDAEVTLTPTAVPDALAADPPSPFEVQTDETGRYTLDTLPLGCTWTLVASGQGFANSLPTGVELPKSRSGTSCDLALRVAARIELSVVGPKGEPVEKGAVRHELENGYTSMRLEDGGHVEFKVSEPGRCRLAVDAPGFPLCVEEFDVALGETKKVEVRLAAGAAIAGVVVDDVGAPVAGARVDVRHYGAIESWGRTAESAADGSFTVDGLPEGPVAFDVEAEFNERAANREAVAPAKDVRVVLTRKGRVTLSARLVPNTPRPKEVTVWVRLARPEAQPWDALTCAWQDDPIVVSLGPEKWEVSLRADGLTSAPREVEVASGATVDLGEVVLGPGLKLSGRVVDAEGRGVANAWISAASEHVSADGDGRFEIGNLRPGAVAVAVDQEGFLSVAVTHQTGAGTEPLTVTLLRGGELRGVVRSSGGAPVSDADVVVRQETGSGPGGDEEFVPITKFGGFTTRVRAGQWLVLLKRDEAIVQTKRVEVTEGGETTANFLVDR